MPDEPEQLVIADDATQCCWGESQWHYCFWPVAPSPSPQAAANRQGQRIADGLTIRIAHGIGQQEHV